MKTVVWVHCCYVHVYLSKWQRVALPMRWRASVHALFHCYLTSPSWITEQISVGKWAPNNLQNGHLDKTNMDKTNLYCKKLFCEWFLIEGKKEIYKIIFMLCYESNKDLFIQRPNNYFMIYTDAVTAVCWLVLMPVQSCKKRKFWREGEWWIISSLDRFFSSPCIHITKV